MPRWRRPRRRAQRPLPRWIWAVASLAMSNDLSSRTQPRVELDSRIADVTQATLRIFLKTSRHQPTP